MRTAFVRGYFVFWPRGCIATIASLTRSRWVRPSHAGATDCPERGYYICAGRLSPFFLACRNGAGLGGFESRRRCFSRTAHTARM